MAAAPTAEADKDVRKKFLRDICTGGLLKQEVAAHGL
jgi:hypothetical protein